MRIRYYWRDCNYLNGKWGATPLDAFWVEATQAEAETTIFPLINAKTQEASLSFARYQAMMRPETRALQFCFLIARDLSSIDPMDHHYPYSNLWNGDSPFEAIDEINIETLEELRAVHPQIEK